MTNYSLFLYIADCFLLAWFYFLFFARNKGLSPAFLFFPIWSLTVYLFYYKLENQLYLYDLMAMVDGSGTIKVIVPFAIASVAGFVFGDILVSPRKTELDMSIIAQDADRIYHKLFFFFYLAAFLGLVRFAISGISVIDLFEIRARYVALYRENNALFIWLNRLWSYSNFFTTFLLFALAVRCVYFKLDWKKNIPLLILYAIPSLLAGARNFLSVIFLYYIIPICFFTYLQEKSIKKTLVRQKNVALLILLGTIFFIIFGIFRNDTSKEISMESFRTKLFYVSDGLAFTDYIVSSGDARNHAFDLSPLFSMSGREKYAQGTLETGMQDFIPSILPDLYYVWGDYFGIYWFFFSFLLQFISLKLRMSQDFSKQLLFFIICSLSFQTAGGNSFGTIYAWLLFWFILNRTPQSKIIEE